MFHMVTDNVSHGNGQTFTSSTILHGGAHFDDVGPSTLRALRRSETERENQNARDKLHRMVVDGGYRRPAVNV